MSVRLSSKEDYESLIDKYDTWLFDCDGVLWQGSRLIDGALEVLHLLRSKKKKVCFVTNNATNSRQTYKKKFDKLGIEAHVDEIYGSAFATAVYLSSILKLPKDKKVFVIGMEGFEEELRDEGISYIGGTDPENQTLEPFSLKDFVLDESVGAVVCGLDFGINYTKLSKAFQYLKRVPGCEFICTNADSTYPSEFGLLPGAGSVSAPLRYATGREPIIVGKPNSTMLDCIKAKVAFDPSRTIMVGDRLNTDIEFGKAGGLSTLLVMSGITQESDITGPNASSTIPDYIAPSVGEFRIVL